VSVMTHNDKRRNDERRQEVLGLLLEGLSQAEVGRRVGISRERVRQIVAESELAGYVQAEFRLKYEELARQKGHIFDGFVREGDRNRIRLRCGACGTTWTRPLDAKIPSCPNETCRQGHVLREATEERWIGRQFGDWTVIERGTKPRHWLCRCKCGTVKDVQDNNLSRGMSRGCHSCGIARREEAYRQGLMNPGPRPPKAD
jgi:hypothetical protein